MPGLPSDAPAGNGRGVAAEVNKMWCVISVILLGLTAFETWYDFHHRSVRLNDWYLVAAAVVAGVVGLSHQSIGAVNSAVYAFALLMLLVWWAMGGMGSGDLKLWLAWWALTPPSQALRHVFALGVILILTSAAQLFFLRKSRGTKHPGVWQIGLYGLWLSATLCCGV